MSFFFFFPSWLPKCSSSQLHHKHRVVLPHSNVPADSASVIIANKTPVIVKTEGAEMMTSVGVCIGTLVSQAMIEWQEPNYFPITNKLKTRLRGTRVKERRWYDKNHNESQWGRNGETRKKISDLRWLTPGTKGHCCPPHNP